MALGSGIRDPRSGIRKKPIPDPGSRGQKAPNPGSRIRIRNTVYRTYYIQKNTDTEGGRSQPEGGHMALLLVFSGREKVCLSVPSPHGFCWGGEEILEVRILVKDTVYNSYRCSQHNPVPFPPPLLHCMNTNS